MLHDDVIIQGHVIQMFGHMIHTYSHMTTHMVT